MENSVWQILAKSSVQTDLYQEVIRVPAMSIGIYKLAAGSRDPQSPHTEDESYYVISGAGQIEIEGENHPVQPGDLIFVPARANHHFTNITDDLVLLVFFAPAEGSTAP
ncbi:MAG: cupin domain-containing protein [Anaerolineae bacterium]|nr:cupin domain-containing protein [Anaerolineae bacterium]